MKRAGGGLGSVLGKIGKKPKLSTLVCLFNAASKNLLADIF